MKSFPAERRRTFRKGWGMDDHKLGEICLAFYFNTAVSRPFVSLNLSETICDQQFSYWLPIEVTQKGES